MKIAVLGLGIMGTAIAERLIENHSEVFVYNRTKSRAERLQKKGAVLAKTSKSAIESADCVILVLTDAQAIKATLLAEGPDNFHGKTIIQMGTIAPLESIEVQKAIFERGGEYFECPVLGSRNEVKDGQLILMVGSSPQKFAEWKDFLKLLGPQPKHVGEVGKAAALKLALNQLIASYASAYAFSLAFLQKEEIRVEDFLEIIRPSSLYTPMLDKKLPKWLNRDYSNPNFSLKHLLKDVDLILREAHHLKLSTQVVKAIRLQLASALSQGLGESDYSAVLESILHDPHTKYP